MRTALGRFSFFRLFCSMQLSKAGGTLFWALIGALLFIPFNGNVHLFDWDEINFAEIAREMVLLNNFQEPFINFVSFTEKPPLFFWLQAGSMMIWGVNEFAARFPNAILGAITLACLFRWGSGMGGARLGYLWALVYTGSVLPHLYFKSGIIDPWFNFFIFSGILGLFRGVQEKKKGNRHLKWMWLAGVATGLGILTKGPVALLITGLMVFVLLAMKLFRGPFSFAQLFHYGCSVILTTALWMGYNFMVNGEKFIVEFTIRQWALLTTPDAGHGGFLMYHFVVLLWGCFPMAAFMIFGFFQRETKSELLATMKQWMQVLFWVVLILFTLVNTKIVHYSSLCYFPMSFLAALSIDRIIANKWRYAAWVKYILWLTALPYLLVPIAIAYLGQNIDELKPLLEADPFAQANLAADVTWSGWEWLPALWMLVVLMLFTWLQQQNKWMRAIQVLFWGAAIWVQAGLFFYIKRVEGYSQRANIEFWESKQGQDVYLTSFGYKTYTHYFYGKIQPPKNHKYHESEWLLKGAVDKPVYISVKITQEEELKQTLPDAKLLYSKNGFSFYERRPVLPAK